MHLDQFAGRVLMRGRLVARTAVHIGAGGGSLDPTAPDAGVVRDAAGNPYVPGSSLKGALRSYLERVMEAGWLAGPRPERCVHAVGERPWEDYVRHARDQARAHGGRNEATLLADAIGAALCPVCRLFGAPHYAGRLLVRDLPVVAGVGPGHWEQHAGQPAWVVHVQERSGVGIDRDTHTARPGVLYDFETVPPGVAFDLQWLVENPSPDDHKNLLLGLLALSRGDVPLGGKSSRGLGQVELAQPEVLDLGRPGLLRRYVLGANLEHEWQPLAAALAESSITEEARVQRAAVLAALEQAGDQLGWADIISRLAPLFGGNSHV